MKHLSIALLTGVLFGLGLAVSGMTMPHRVIGFLSFFGSWDPTLAFVMIGAISVHFMAYRMIKHKTSPLLSDKFYIPTNRSIDRPLIVGSILFGIGWGIAGYCPGPGLVSLVTLSFDAVAFVGAMSAGILLQGWITQRKTKEVPLVNA